MLCVLCYVAGECCVSKYGFQEMPLVEGNRASQSWTLGCAGGWMASLEARIRRREKEANWYGVRQRAEQVGRMRNKTEKDGAEGEIWEITPDTNKRGQGNRKKGRPSFASDSGLGADRDWVCFRKMAAREERRGGRGPRKGRKQANPG